MQKLAFFSCFFAFFLASATIKAQRDNGTFEATAIAGFNMAQIDGDQDGGFNKLGLNLGGRVGVGLSKKFEVALELLFSQKGSQNRYVRGVPRNLQCTLNYIEIPLEFSFRDWEVTNSETQEKYMRIYFSAGASYSRLVGGKLQIGGIDEGIDRFRTNEIMMMFSGSVFITRHWGFNLRWSRSLTSITDNSTSSSSGGWGKAVNRMITIRALYKF
jgi:hypothetical protein